MLKEYQNAIEDCISILSIFDPPPKDPFLFEEWIQDLTTLFDECCEFGELTRGQKTKREEVMETAIGLLQEQSQEKQQVPTLYDKIIKQAQVIQRTPNWYSLRQGAISATQVPNLFASARQYGTMVLEKAGKMERRSGSREACYTQDMTPFDWGIRFEPVIRHCLQTLWKQTIEEVGCFVHENPDLHLVASPDGLMKSGSLVEFKCPITREIGVKIPDDYWQQMQIQMEVTGAEECQYAEAIFSSPMPQRYNMFEGPELLSGTIYLCQRDDGSLTYNYSLEPNATIVEIIPWRLIGFHTVTVKRDHVWFQTQVLPRIKKFWEDVLTAKEGNFVLPESTRKRKQTCDIIMD